MIKKLYEQKISFNIYINIKNRLYMLMSFKFKYIPYKIEKSDCLD